MSNLDQISGIPLYIQIRERILEQIKNNEIRTGDKLPTEEEIARDTGVSRLTVRRAMDDLVAEGLLQRIRGKGTFVVSRRMARHYSRLTSFYEEAAEQGLKPSSKLLSYSVISAPSHLAARLHVEPGAQVHSIRRLRMLDQDPVAVHQVYIPCYLLQELEIQELEEQSLYKIYQQNKTPVRWARQRIEAHLANKEMAEFLGLEVGAPMLYIECVTYTDDDRPLEWLQGYYNAASYASEVTLYRDGPQNR